jgi:hypothetical protein
MIHQRVRRCLWRPLRGHAVRQQSAGDERSHQHAHQPKASQCSPKIGQQSDPVETQQFRKNVRTHEGFSILIFDF